MCVYVYVYKLVCVYKYHQKCQVLKKIDRPFAACCNLNFTLVLLKPLVPGVH